MVPTSALFINSLIDSGDFLIAAGSGDQLIKTLYCNAKEPPFLYCTVYMYCRQSRQVFRYPQLAQRIKVNWANIIHLHHYSILNNKSTSTSPSQKIPAEMYTELILSTQSGSALILISQILIRVYLSKCRSGLRYQKGPKKQNQRNISFTKIVSKKTFSVISFNSWKLTFLHDFYSWIL